MAKLPRITQKIFGKNAPENQITTFGSIKAGTPVYTQSPSQIMNANFEEGWSAAVEDDYAPYRQDRNGVDTAVTQQLAYLFQEGIPEWDSGTTYYKGSVVKVVNGNALTFYKSIADNNTSSVNTTNKWHKMLEINSSNQIVSPTINTPTISGGSMSNGSFENPTFSGTVNVPLASASSSTDSTIAASIGWANNPSLSSNIVHKTGNENIGGVKTFTSAVTYKGNAGLTYNSIHSSAVKGTTPTSNANSTFSFLDSTFSNSYTATISRTQYGYDTSGKTYAKLQALKPEADSTQTGTIAIYYPSSGNPYTEAPTPATSDDSTKIATTAYVQSNLSSYALDNSVVKLTGNQSIAGDKTFNNTIITGTSGIKFNTGDGTDFWQVRPSGSPSTGLNFLLNNNTSYSGLNFSASKVRIGGSNISAEAPTPTEDTTTSAQIDTVGARNTKLSNYVTLSGAQTISGAKTFTSNIVMTKNGPAIQQINTNITKGTAPSSNINTIPILYRDNDSKNLSGLAFHYNTSKDVHTRLYAYKSSASTDNAGVYLRVFYGANGSYGLMLSSDNTGTDTNTSLTKSTTSTTDTTIPCMGWVNSRITDILTTSGAGLAEFSKTNNGYYKFSNGLIIQWGRNNNTTSSNLFTVNFSIPFTASNSYSLVTTCTHTSFSASGRGYTTNSATTSVDVVCDSDYSPVKWIAIGY